MGAMHAHVRTARTVWPISIRISIRNKQSFRDALGVHCTGRGCSWHACLTLDHMGHGSCALGRLFQAQNGLLRLTSRQSSTPGPKRACRLPLANALRHTRCGQLPGGQWSGERRSMFLWLKLR